VKLFFDLNGDNKFKESDYEMIKARTNLSASDNLSLSLVIPEDFRGLQPWKFEVTDNTTNAVMNKTGFMAFRGDNPINVNVLQIACDGNTFNLATELKDELGNNLLTAFEEDYEINVDVMHISDFKKLYDTSGFTLADYIKEGNTKPYNMIIFGFDDVYGGADITDEDMANDIKDFINTGQSVMFTHDNLTFRVDSKTGWARGLTTYFRDYVGQNIYQYIDEIKEMPDATATTLGYSKMAIERSEGLGFTTTTTVYAANDGIMANYPFRILDTTDIKDFYDYTYAERKLTVATTHYQYYQLDLNNEDVVVWYTLTGGSGRNDYHDPANYYYTYSIGNITYSGTGHSNLTNANSYDERRLFVNTIVKAIRGANFAPELVIQGVTNGENISKGRTEMSFSILATDPDINDEYLDGLVYLDMNGDGIYTSDELVNQYSRTDYTDGVNSAVESGIAKEVTLDLSKLTSGLSEFGFKVLVSDKEGASASKEYRFPLVDAPVLNMTISAPNGMLVGDSVTISTNIGVTIPSESLETKIEDIEHRAYIYNDDTAVSLVPMDTTDKFTISSLNGYVSEGSQLLKSFSPITSLVRGTYSDLGSSSYLLKAKEAGDFILKSDLDYSLDYYNIDSSIERSQEFGVEKGRIQYTLIDDFGIGVKTTMTGVLYHYTDALRQ
jgi:hypothetical protein